mmetsp:Transcript_12045/g.14034  ORF Transcript_12045/g.14034 Transcript_12045/m.14034 type:complete len:196 (+) Transcript_12045:125-712(+)
MEKVNKESVEATSTSATCDDGTCGEMLAKGLSVPRVKELRESMEKLGCVTPKRFFACRPCENESIIAGFVYDGENKVVLCSDNIEKFNIKQEHVDRTLIHELIHAYDHCRAEMDWKNCLHIACSEIRAANLSGDCNMKAEFNRGNFGFKRQGEECVKRRAELSLTAHPQCKDIAKKAIETVLDSCMSDTAPFLFR